MSEVIKFERIVSVSSEVQGHSAQNILEGEIRPNKNWTCEAGTEKAALILQLQRAAVLSSIHVGNAHSAFVEVLVGRAADGSDRFESFVPMSSFMSPHESKTGTNPNRTRFFTKEDFNADAATKCWDRLKVVCSQPFNRHVRYGLCFLKVLGEAEAKKTEAPAKSEDKDEIKVGSFFKKLRASGGDKPLTVSEQIKQAEKELSLGQRTSISIAKVSEKMSEKKAKPTAESKGEKKKNKSPRKEEGKDKSKDGRPSEAKEREAIRRRQTEPSGDGKTDKRRKKTRRRPFAKLMEDVVLVISGFKNPLRGDIRSKALQMGAKYRADWEPHCTHLVCAYENTPKCQQVKGKGKIVRKEWVEHCHRDRKRYPWRRFALDKGDAKRPESEEEVEEEEQEEQEESEEDEEVAGCSVGTSSQVQSTECSSSTQLGSGTGVDDYDAATDEDEGNEETVDTTDYPMPYLPDMFSLKTFFLDPTLQERAILERYIIAYNGVIRKAFDAGVDYYVTKKGGAPLEVFRKKAPNVVVVKPSWIWEINAKERCVSPTSHLVK